MKEEFKKQHRIDDHILFTKFIRAGKRTYFIDVRASNNSDLYVTITEKKKCTPLTGKPFSEKHQIFLYKEDFEKFRDSLDEIIKYVDENNPCLEPIVNEEFS
jgi:hypothetical protein